MVQAPRHIVYLGEDLASRLREKEIFLLLCPAPRALPPLEPFAFTGTHLEIY